MPTANLTGSPLPFRDAKGVLHVWPSCGRYTLGDCQADNTQGVSIIVDREVGTDAQLQRARQASDQYFGVPVIVDGEMTAIHWSDGKTMPVADMVPFKSWKNDVLIIAVGSADAVLTAAALANIVTADQHRSTDDCRVQWVQAHTVDRVALPDDETLDVWLVDLAVDMLDAGRTERLLERIRVGNHRLVGVIDEHDPTAWRALLSEAEMAALKVKPLALTSSGAVLLAQIGQWSWVAPGDMALLHEADLADRGDFSGGRRQVVNAAIKSKISDDTRRTACWEWLVGIQRRPDGSLKEIGPVSTSIPAQIDAWRREYEQHQHAFGHTLEAASIDARGAVVLKANTPIDISAVCFEAYKRWPGRLVVLHSIIDGNEGTMLAMEPGSALDLVAILRRQAISVRGLPLRVAVAHEDERKAVEAVLTSEAFRQHRTRVGLPQPE